MRNRLFALATVLGLAALASAMPSATATVYCSDRFCAGQAEDTACPCPPGTDKAGNPSNCQLWSSISAGGCWYE